MIHSLPKAIFLLFMYLGTFICSTESVHTESVFDTVYGCFNGENWLFSMDQSTLEYVQARITKSDVEQLLLSNTGKRALSVLKNYIDPSLFYDFVNNENFVKLFTEFSEGVERPVYNYLPLLMLNFTKFGGAHVILNAVGDGMVPFLPDSYAAEVEGAFDLLCIDIFSMLFQNISVLYQDDDLNCFSEILSELRKNWFLDDVAKRTILQNLEFGQSTYLRAGLIADLGHLNFVMFTKIDSDMFDVKIFETNDLWNTAVEIESKWKINAVCSMKMSLDEIEEANFFLFRDMTLNEYLTKMRQFDFIGEDVVRSVQKSSTCGMRNLFNLMRHNLGDDLYYFAKSLMIMEILFRIREPNVKEAYEKMEPHGDYWKIILDQHLIERKVLHMIDKIKDEGLASECLEIFHNYSQKFEIKIADNFEELREMILTDNFSIDPYECAFSFLNQVSNIDELKTKKAIKKAIRLIDINKSVYLSIFNTFPMEETWENSWYLGRPLPFGLVCSPEMNVPTEKTSMKQLKKCRFSLAVASHVKFEIVLSIVIASVFSYFALLQ